jgi:exodeoxyribonuclease VII large subunit
VEKDSNLQQIWVEGEISNFTRHSSGHMYFTLKDESARLRCVMFRRENQRLKFLPQDGMAVTLFGRLAIYPKNGEYQLYVEVMEASGVGSLYLAFEQLKQRLAEEGLFDQARKRRLPTLPRRIGVITSPTGAAVRDIIRILHRRYPQVEILVIPAQVQGESAPQSLVAGLNLVRRLSGLDLVIIGRGGGSIEELWAFNDENVARAIALCPVPVISAVGHETDFTIADFVADLRAPTPSAAAEVSVPEIKKLRERLGAMEYRLKALVLQALEKKRIILSKTSNHPALTRPDRWLAVRRQQVDLAVEDIKKSIRSKVEDNKHRLLQKIAKLEALSPLATLARGYSICRLQDGSILRQAGQAQPEEEINVLLHQGELLCTVKEVREERDR